MRVNELPYHAKSLGPGAARGFTDTRFRLGCNV